MLALLLTLALPFSFVGCAGDEEEKTRVDPAAAQDKVDLGVFAAMDAINNDMDFTGSYNLFAEAVRLDPNNMQAKAGAGATNLLRLPYDPMVAGLIEDLGLDDFLKGSPPWKSLGFKTGNGLAGAGSRAILGSLSGQAQTDMNALLAYLLVQIQTSINYFDAVEGDADFTWLLPMPEGYGMDTLEIDVTDVHFVESPLHFVRSLLYGLSAYDLDIDSYDNAGLIAALSQDSDFLTLTNAGAMTSAEGAMNLGADEARTGALLLEAETDDQTNDFVRLLFPGEEFGDWVAMTEGQRDTLENMPTMIDDMMDNPMPIVEDLNGDDEPDTLVLNLGVLFDDPVDNWKALLPDYTITACGDTAFALLWDAATVEAWTWHPEALNGFLALPGGPMTSDAMVEMFGLEAFFALGGGCP